MSSKAVIHVVDDDASFRKAVTRLLRVHGYEVVAYQSAEEYLSSPGSARGCLLLDVRMPGISGLQAQRILADRSHALPIIFVSGHGDIPMSVHTIKAGAEDFLTKPVPIKRLLAAIATALERHDADRAQHGALQEVRDRFALLSPREVEVFNRVITGMLNKVVAFELGTAERTVKAHRHNVMVKMGAKSLAELVGLAQLLRG